MLYLALKTVLTALIVVGAAELGKRVPFFAALLISLPLMSILALSWLYIDTRDLAKVSALSWQILALVPPSLIFFAALPIALKAGLGYPLSLLAACAITALTYGVWTLVMKQFGVVL